MKIYLNSNGKNNDKSKEKEIYIYQNYIIKQ